MKTVLFYSVFFYVIGILSCHKHLNEKLTLDASELNGLDTLVDKYDNNGFASDLSPPSNFPLTHVWRTLFGLLNNRNNNGVFRFFVWRKFDENSTPILIKHTIHTNNFLKKTLRDMRINLTQDNKNNTSVFKDNSINNYNVSVKTDVQQNASRSITSNSKKVQINQTLYPKNLFEKHFKGIEIESTQDSKGTTTIINNYLTKVHNVSNETSIHQNPNRSISRDVEQNLSQIQTKQSSYPQKNFKRQVEINSTQVNINNTTILNKYSNDNYNVSVKTDIHKNASLIKNVDNNSSTFQIKHTAYPKNISERIFKGKENNLIQDNENSTTIMNKHSTNTYNVSVKAHIQQNTSQSITPDVESQTLMNSKMYDTKMLKPKPNSDQSHTFNYYQQNKADADKISGEISSSSLLSDNVFIINKNNNLKIFFGMAVIGFTFGVVVFVVKKNQGGLATFLSRRTENNSEIPV